MWKRIREATSGFNLQYFTNIFRRRRYDNLPVPQSDEIISDSKCISDIEIGTSSESGYGDDGHLDSRLSPKCYHSDSLDGIDEIEENNIIQSEYSIENPSPVISMTGEAKDLVASYTQRRYKQLDDTDEIVGIEADDNKKTTDAGDSGVFHSYKDTVPSKKQKRKQKRKKMRAKTRKAVRRSLSFLLDSFIAGFAYGYGYVPEYTRSKRGPFESYRRPGNG